MPVLSFLDFHSLTWPDCRHLPVRDAESSWPPFPPLPVARLTGATLVDGQQLLDSTRTVPPSAPMSSNAELHALFTSRSLAKARQVLARVGGAGGKGAGLSKSPNNYGGGGGMANAAIAIEVNRRDAMGRTLLHRVVSEVDVWADEWLDWLLGVSGVGVNLVDQESGWTALHR